MYTASLWKLKSVFLSLCNIFITGIIRGSKHWTFSKHEALWEKLSPILKTGMARITVETVEDWGTCMATTSADRDPNRLSPLMELLMDDPLRASEGAFNGSRFGRKNK